MTSAFKRVEIEWVMFFFQDEEDVEKDVNIAGGNVFIKTMISLIILDKMMLIVDDVLYEVHV